ncbi:MAG TPA: transporter [Terriglobales bacterium]
MALLRTPERAQAQFTDPHTYDNAPVGTNVLELGYDYARADASLDTFFVIAGARLDLNQGIVDYTRYFGLFHRLIWVKAGVPVANLSGSIQGTNIQGSTTGTGDSGYEAAILLKGGPALTADQFETYRPSTTVGVDLAIAAPTGSYNANKILNLGSDRWSFKPEIAVSHPFGLEQKWQIDAYANAYFFTNNTSYRGKEILRQDPLPGLEAHLSYFLLENLWASIDTRYAFRGETWVSGVNQNDAQKAFILGSEMNVAVNARHSFTFKFAKAVVHENAPTQTGFEVKYSYTWAKGYK